MYIGINPFLIRVIINPMRLTQILLFLTILFAPLYVVRFENWGLPTTLLEVLMIVTMAVSVSEFLWLHHQKSFKEIGTFLLQRFRSLKFGWLGILFLAAALISVFISQDKLGAFGIFKAYFLEPVGIYLVVVLFLRHRRRRLQNTLLFPLLLSGLWISLLVIFQKFFHFPNFASWEMKLGRPSAVFNSSNSVGLFLGPILGLAIGKLFDKRNRLIYAVLLVLIVIAVFFTQSEGAILGILVVLFFALVYAILTSCHFFGRLARDGKLIRFLKYFRYVFFTIFIVHFLLLGFQFFYIDQFAPKVQNPWIRGGSTVTIRLCLWQGTKNLILDNPLFGAGLSGFKEVYSSQYITCDAEPLEYPHNLALNFWVETGLLGLITFFIIIFMVLTSHIETNGTNKTHEVNLVRLGVKLALVYILVHGLVDVPYFKNDLALQFWMIISIFEFSSLTKAKDIAIL